MYASPYVIRVMKSRRVRWTVHAARMGKCEMYIKFLSESLKGRALEDRIRIDIREIG
jgi:hypothetical protein